MAQPGSANGRVRCGSDQRRAAGVSGGGGGRRARLAAVLSHALQKPSQRGFRRGQETLRQKGGDIAEQRCQGARRLAQPPGAWQKVRGRRAGTPGAANRTPRTACHSCPAQARPPAAACAGGGAGCGPPRGAWQQARRTPTARAERCSYRTACQLPPPSSCSASKNAVTALSSQAASPSSARWRCGARRICARVRHPTNRGRDSSRLAPGSRSFEWGHRQLQCPNNPISRQAHAFPARPHLARRHLVVVVASAVL